MNDEYGISVRVAVPTVVVLVVAGAMIGWGTHTLYTSWRRIKTNSN